MDRIVSNATPLIYLAKIDKLKLLKAIANQVYIPEAVYQEVVIEGRGDRSMRNYYEIYYPNK